MLYPHILTKDTINTPTDKGVERGGWWGRKCNICVGSVYKHSLQLRDPTQRNDAC